MTISTNLFHVHIIMFPDYFLYIEKWLHHGNQRKSLFRFLDSLHFGSLLYFYSIFLCPPLPLGILLNQERSPFYAQFICLLPPLPVFIRKTEALTRMNSYLVEENNKSWRIFRPFPRILIAFSIICGKYWSGDKCWLAGGVTAPESGLAETSYCKQQKSYSYKAFSYQNITNKVIWNYFNCN